ncbi:MAG: helix-turn-helix transcriptional regulator [Actinomycetota bacterium]|nr:helix-turn-helix transcriptional regulator [Actinomycetota bacterium]
MARRRAGLTQRELAERLGLRQATIARWERGDRQVSVEDVEAVADACGLHLESHLVVEDRSWWSQIALRLELDPLDRLQRLTPASSPNLAAGLGELAATGHPVVVIGEVAGALQGWPLVLGGDVIEVCAENARPLTDIGRHLGRHEYGLPTGARLRAVDAPPGTHGFRDLWRGAEPVDVDGGELHVANVLDLLRIADASDRRSARLEALAYQAVLDVQDARSKEPTEDGRTATERIEAWLKHQTPVATQGTRSTPAAASC